MLNRIHANHTKAMHFTFGKSSRSLAGCFTCSSYDKTFISSFMSWYQGSAMFCFTVRHYGMYHGSNAHFCREIRRYPRSTNQYLFPWDPAEHKISRDVLSQTPKTSKILPSGIHQHVPSSSAVPRGLLHDVLSLPVAANATAERRRGSHTEVTPGDLSGERRKISGQNVTRIAGKENSDAPCIWPSGTEMWLAGNA